MTPPEWNDWIWTGIYVAFVVSLIALGLVLGSLMGLSDED